MLRWIPEESQRWHWLPSLQLLCHSLPTFTCQRIQPQGPRRGDDANFWKRWDQVFVSLLYSARPKLSSLHRTSPLKWQPKKCEIASANWAPPNPRRFIPQLWHNVGEIWGWTRDRGYKNGISKPRCRWQFSSNYGAIVCPLGCPPLAKLPLNNPFPAIKSKGNSSRVSGIAPTPDPQFSLVRIIRNLSWSLEKSLFFKFTLRSQHPPSGLLHRRQLDLLGGLRGGPKQRNL